MIRVVLAAVLAICAGFYAGYLSAPDVDQAVTTSTAVGTVTESPGCRATLASADVELLKRELASAIAHSTATAPSRIEQRTTTPQLQTDETIAANESLQDVLNVAVANGVWTNEDAVAMNGLMRRASPHAVDKALSRLAAAINDQRLRIETAGFPF